MKVGRQRPQWVDNRPLFSGFECLGNMDETGYRWDGRGKMGLVREYFILFFLETVFGLSLT